MSNTKLEQLEILNLKHFEKRYHITYIPQWYQVSYIPDVTQISLKKVSSSWHLLDFSSLSSHINSHKQGVLVAV